MGLMQKEVAELIGISRGHYIDFEIEYVDYYPKEIVDKLMRGHPVFVAQHATATCCRGCLEKWHGIPNGVDLSQEQLKYIVRLLMV